MKIEIKNESRLGQVLAKYSDEDKAIYLEELFELKRAMLGDPEHDSGYSNDEEIAKCNSQSAIIRELHKNAERLNEIIRNDIDAPYIGLDGRLYIADKDILVRTVIMINLLK